jgi:hypothetical protein
MSRNQIVVEQLSQTGRKQRRPTHPFNIKFRPFEITPFLIAPVLPGETMKNLLLQARCVSDPIKNPLIGWHNEYYFFYVKLRDLDDRDLITDMIVKNSAMPQHPYSQQQYHKSGYNFVEACTKVCVREYFRDEEEELSVHRYPDSPFDLAKITNDNYLQSVLRDSDAPKPEQEEFPGENTQQAANAPPGFADHYAHWEAMRSMQLVAVDFEDWLKTFGVKVPKAAAEEVHVPELLRYVREWAYPANTINPVDGAPSSAMSWSIAERADKDRFFSEPGFVFGLTVARPKVYLGNLSGSLTSYMNDAYSWLPALLNDDPYTSLRKFGMNDGPVAGGNTGESYWVDLRDLFLYGEQFTDFENFANFVTLPRNAAAGEGVEVKLNKKYVSEADADGFFKNPALGKYLRVDGRVDLTVMSRITDSTPATP